MDDMTTMGETSALPPDGTVIRVSQWRQQVAWIPTAIYGFLAIWSPVYAIQKGVPAAVFIGVIGLD